MVCCSPLSYAWERQAAFDTRSFQLGELARGVMPGFAGATAELKLAIAHHLVRVLAVARERAASENTVLSLQVQVDDFIMSAAGPSQAGVPRLAHGLLAKVV